MNRIKTGVTKNTAAHIRTAVSIFTTVLLVTGCSSIPVSAPIKYGQDLTVNQPNQFIQVIGRPPIDGMDQIAVVNGFLTALADTRDDYGIAREYLTQAAAQTWRSDSAITIYESGSLEITQTQSGALASLSKFGQIDSTGYLTVEPKGTQLTAAFDLIKNENDQWRISALADGVLLTSNDIERSFNGYPAYFLDADRKNLVPDTVLLPANLTGLATSLVQALLDGPSNKIAQAVSNSFPVGTKLTYGSVPVVDGVATVDLTNQILSTDQATRALMSAQLVWTLNSLPNVSSIEIKVSGQPVSITGVSTRQTGQDWASYNPAQFTGAELLHFVKDNQVFSYGVDGVLTPMVQVSQDSQVTLGESIGDIDGGSIAGVSVDGKKVLFNTGRGGQFSVVASGQSVSKPSWDKFGSIYYSDYGNGIFKIDTKGQKQKINFDSSNFANVDQVKQVSIAHDGTRIALVISDGSTDLLLFGAIVEIESVSRIVGLHLVERTITAIKDLAWQTPTSIAVLGSDLTGGSLVFDVDITTGTTSSIAAPIGAQTIASSIGKQIYVGTVSGAKLMVAKQSGTQWADLVEGASPYFAN